MPDRLLCPEGGVIADFSRATRLDSREATCVYLNQFDAYKLFSTYEKAQEAAQRAKVAREAGVPIARSTKAAYPAKLNLHNGESSDVYVLEMERHMGDFFQLSKQGGVSSLAKKILNSNTENRRKAVRAFEAAKAHKITDPQGFFDPTLGMPIRFFDIHTGSSPAPQIQQIIERLSAT